jgi:hypothetical protein
MKREKSGFYTAKGRLAQVSALTTKALIFYVKGMQLHYRLGKL